MIFPAGKAGKLKNEKIEKLGSNSKNNDKFFCRLKDGFNSEILVQDFWGKHGKTSKWRHFP
jgi:hypothetical protein